MGSGTQTSPSPAVQLTQGEGGAGGGPGLPRRSGKELRAGQHRRAPATPGEGNRGLLRPLEAKGWREQAGQATPKSTSEPAPGPAGRKPQHAGAEAGGPWGHRVGHLLGRTRAAGPVQGRTLFPRIRLFPDSRELHPGRWVGQPHPGMPGRGPEHQ